MQFQPQRPLREKLWPPQTNENELADRYYERRHDDDEWADPEPVDRPARLTMTLSVRFTAEELEAVRAIAATKTTGSARILKELRALCQTLRGRWPTLPGTVELHDAHAAV